MSKGSEANCEVCEIQTTPTDTNPTGIVVINMSDFIEGFHKPFGVIAPAPTASVDIGGGGPHIEIETSVTETTKSPWSK